MTMTSAPSAGFWRRYGRMWAAAPKEFAAIVALGVTGYVAFGVAWALFSAGIGTIVVLLIGLFILIAGMYAARWLGVADLAIIEWSGRPPIAQPVWPSRRGFLPWLGGVLGSAHYWLALAYYLLPRFVLSIVTVVLAVTSIGIALGGVLWVTWGWALPATPDLPDLWSGRGWFTDGVDGLVSSALRIAAGIVFAAFLPYILRGLTWAQWGLARLMLGAFRSEALQVELAGVEASRAAAVAAEDSALRRLERDIHDGPQQRLIRVQMDLASAERRLTESPEAARELIGSASEQAKEALEELRALSRGFAPPILQDRGLIAALESAATRSAVPVDIVDGLPAGTQLPPEIERNAYFIASEGLVNATKHARATRIGIAITLDASGRALDVTVSDDGVGGAAPRTGHGLAGLEERIAGLGGTWSLSSPDGGPTVLTARLPW